MPKAKLTRPTLNSSLLTLNSEGARLTPAPPPGRLIDLPPFQQGVEVHLANEQLRANLRLATSTIRAKRERVTAELHNWEELRTAGQEIKDHTLEHLPWYLALLEHNLKANGAQVHWAADAAEACDIITQIIKEKAAKEVVKVKSMVTQEIELNEALEDAGIACWETDLAELIVQLGHDRPSNILVPAIHKNRDEIREIFLREMKLYGKPAPKDLSNDPQKLAAAAREHLRDKFLRAEVAISGANFCVADSGSLVIVESEGNGRMCLTLPKTLISVTGIEKVVPSFEDLEVMLQLLPRSATGERMNPYTSIWSGPTPGDGPQEVHVVLLDNGRSLVLEDPVGREVLRCIRCAACMHQCPVYQRVGGHPYGSVYPGPIGSVLTPQLRGLSSKIDQSLPYASTLCGACAEVCPVKIPLPDLLVYLRQRVVEEKMRGRLGLEQSLMGLAGWAMKKGKRFGRVGALASVASKVLRKDYLTALPSLGKRWTNSRDLRLPAKQNFRSWWKRHESKGESKLYVHLDSKVYVPFDSFDSPPVTHIPFSMTQRPGPTVTSVFIDRLTDYKATVARASNSAEVSKLVFGFLREVGAKSVVVPPGINKAWLSATVVSSIRVLGDSPALSKQTLNKTSAVITAASAAIAETGTIILDHRANQGRRVISLLPDTHICIVKADQILESVSDTGKKLTLSLKEKRPMTWISGPSATVDIELIRVEGVHGPRNLFVIIVD